MFKKLSYRKFFFLFLITTSLFLTYHLLIWTFLTSKIFNISPYYVGDLGRMSYQIDSLFPRLEENNLPSKHIDGRNWHNQPIDIITLGDSFSNGMASGKNAYYQDFLATSLRINVLNIQNIDASFGYIDTIRYLHKNKWLAKVKPKAILIQCVVRESLRHIPAKPHATFLTPEKLNHYLFKTNFTKEFPHPMVINTANYKAPYYYIQYRYSVHAKNEVYKLPLTKDFFTAKDTNHLLFYHDDLNKISDFTEVTIAQLNNELNTLADELKRDHIALLFMPSVDKYDLYHDDIQRNNDYPKNPFFPLLRKQQKSYILVDTKAILRPMIEKNIQDVYYADDTHWSFKASEQLANDKIFTFLKDKK